MWYLKKPSASCLDKLAAEQSTLLPSYPEVGATRGEFPAGYDHDRNFKVLGSGEQDFLKAVDALRRWVMFPSAWTTIHPATTPQQTGNVVVLVFNLLGMHWTSAAKIVYEVDETDTPEVKRRVGFAYGTLPDHVECGEERFTIAWKHDDSVVYELQAFSRPQFWMARLAKPLARRWQKRFVRDSQTAMLHAVTPQN